MENFLMKSNLRFLLGAAILLAAVHVQPLFAADTFSFAGVTFDQRFAPNKVTLLGNSTNLGGAVFSVGVATEVGDQSLLFPQPPTVGFNSAASLGSLAFGNAGVRTVSLPSGNQGVSTRHGLDVGWTNSVGIQNLAGIDFAIYESGSTSNGVEGVMVRVRYERNPETWTPWYYFSPANYQLYTNTKPEVAFVYAYDLTALGVPADKLVDKIQMANLINNDRIETTVTNTYGANVVGQGLVGFGQSATNNIRPDAGNFNLNNHVFNSSSDLDPDPFYVGIINPMCETVVPTLKVTALGGGNVSVTWPWPTCYLLESATVLLETNTVWTLETNVTISATLNTAAVSTTNSARFFRLSK